MRIAPLVRLLTIATWPALGWIAMRPWFAIAGTPPQFTQTEPSVPPRPSSGDPRILALALQHLANSRALEPTVETDASSLPVEVAAVATEPALLLTGVVLGERPTAFLERIPGVEGGRAVREGERIAGILVRRVLLDRVIVTRAESTWTVAVRRSTEPDDR